jgi:hypothetical protein
MYTPVIAEHDDTYHSYANAGGKLPGADGGPEHLCTETLNRPHATLIDCVDKIGGKNNGFVAWELMIGRDNCRFPWVTPTAWTNPPNPSMAWSTPTVIRGM